MLFPWRSLQKKKENIIIMTRANADIKELNNLPAVMACFGEKMGKIRMCNQKILLGSAKFILTTGI